MNDKKNLSYIENKKYKLVKNKNFFAFGLLGSGAITSGLIASGLGISLLPALLNYFLVGGVPQLVSFLFTASFKKNEVKNEWLLSLLKFLRPKAKNNQEQWATFWNEFMIEYVFRYKFDMNNKIKIFINNQIDKPINFTRLYGKNNLRELYLFSEKLYPGMVKEIFSSYLNELPITASIIETNDVNMFHFFKELNLFEITPTDEKYFLNLVENFSGGYDKHLDEVIFEEIYQLYINKKIPEQIIDYLNLVANDNTWPMVKKMKSQNEALLIGKEINKDFDTKNHTNKI